MYVSSTKQETRDLFYNTVDGKEQDDIRSPNSTSTRLPTEWLHSFNALNLSDENCRQSQATDFIGGFHPGVCSPATIPVRNPPMPTPRDSTGQSLTMRMALRLEGTYDNSAPEPDLRTKKRTFKQSTLSPNSAGASTSFIDTTNNSVSVTPLRNRVASASNGPQIQSSITPERQQCAGITKAGKQCTRQVKSGSPSTSEEVFCFQHLKELMGPSGFYGRKDGTWIDFTDWIPHYLHPDTQVALRIEMEKARSLSDVPGYIYTFEIRDPDKIDTVKLKVGRAVNLVKRIDEWEKQCGSKEQVLRGYYPSVSDTSSGTSLMKGRVKVGKIGPWCHRLERLIHIELADLASSGVYLTPAWPEVGQQISNSSSSMKRSISGQAKPVLCGDCGSLHKEIFEFKKFTGSLRGHEWEKVVFPVIQRWGKFVEQCV